MHPYTSEGQTILDVQTVIQIPEVADYQVCIREKKLRKRESGNISRDFTNYDVHIADHEYAALSKRWMMFRLVSGVLQNGGSPEKII